MQQTLRVITPADDWMEPAMELALAQARSALATQDVPVGAVVLDADGAVIGTGRNERVAINDPLSHAEIVAIRAAARSRGNYRLDDATLVVTLEPCLMCTGAVMQSRIGRVIFGAWDAKAGACGSAWDVVATNRSPHKLTVTGGVREAECASLLTEFFRARRKKPEARPAGECERTAHPANRGGPS